MFHFPFPSQLWTILRCSLIQHNEVCICNVTNRKLSRLMNASVKLCIWPISLPFLPFLPVVDRSVGQASTCRVTLHSPPCCVICQLQFAAVRVRWRRGDSLQVHSNHLIKRLNKQSIYKNKTQNLLMPRVWNVRNPFLFSPAWQNTTPSSFKHQNVVRNVRALSRHTRKQTYSAFKMRRSVWKPWKCPALIWQFVSNWTQKKKCNK